MRAGMSFSTSAAWRPTCCDATAAARGGTACGTSRRVANGRSTRAAIEAAGAQLRVLPPYSPDLNPIEQAFAKLKALLRPARPRTFDQICALVGAAIPRFTPDECRNFVRNSGYRFATAT